MRQVSLESIPIFDFILELHAHCGGHWNSFIRDDVSEESLDKFLTYAATFLSNVGNYYVCHLRLRIILLWISNEGQGPGDQKFVPSVDPRVVQALASKSERLASLYDEISGPMFAVPPYGLGYPSDTAQSSYYPGGNLSEAEILSISKLLEVEGIYPENTRISK